MQNMKSDCKGGTSVKKKNHLRDNECMGGKNNRIVY